MTISRPNSHPRPAARCISAASTSTLVAAPNPLQCAWQRMLGDAGIDVARAEREREAIGVAFGLQRRRQAPVRQRPVVPGLFRIVVMQVLLAHFEPDA